MSQSVLNSKIVLYIRDADFLLFSVIFGPIRSPPICFPFSVFSIFSYFIFLFLNFLSLFVFIFCETARTRRFSVIFAKVQWHPCVYAVYSFFYSLVSSSDLCLQVESLTAARKSCLNGNEPSDAIRVVNAVLTQIDQLKKWVQMIVGYVN